MSDKEITESSGLMDLLLPGMYRVKMCIFLFQMRNFLYSTSRQRVYIQ